MKFSIIRNTNFPTPAQKEDYVNDRREIITYTIGFVLSIFLTVLAYLLVVLDLSISDGWVMGTILWFAVVQLFIQIYYFLHLGSGERPRFNLLIFVLTIIILVIIVGGSLWIMWDLADRMMPGPPPPDSLPPFSEMMKDM